MSRLSLSRPGDAAGPPPPRVNSVREGSDADCRALVTCKMSSAYEKTRFSKGTDTIFPSRLDTTHLSFDLSSPARSRPEVPINAQAPPPPCPISPLCGTCAAARRPRISSRMLAAALLPAAAAPLLLVCMLLPLLAPPNPLCSRCTLFIPITNPHKIHPSSSPQSIHSLHPRQLGSSLAYSCIATPR